MKKLIITIVAMVALISSQHLSAQTKHEFSVYGGGGLSTMRYQLSLGDRSGGFGGDFGVGYTYFRVKERAVETGKVFQEHWGIHTGIGIDMYSSTAKLNNQTAITKGLSDGDQQLVNGKRVDQFDLHTTLSGYNENQKAMLLNIPVMALFQIEQFYAMSGVKIGIPINGKYSSKNATLTNKAYYHELDNWLTTQTFAGYGEFRGRDSDGKLDLGVSVALALEAGMKWDISDKLSLYTGVYFDYGLTNVTKGGNTQFVNYNANNAENFTTNSVLSSYTDNSKSATFTDKVNMTAIGIKLRLALEI